MLRWTEALLIYCVTIGIIAAIMAFQVMPTNKDRILRQTTEYLDKVCVYDINGVPDLIFYDNDTGKRLGGAVDNTTFCINREYQNITLIATWGRNVKRIT